MITTTKNNKNNIKKYLLRTTWETPTHYHKLPIQCTNYLLLSNCSEIVKIYYTFIIYSFCLCINEVGNKIETGGRHQYDHK